MSRLKDESVLDLPANLPKGCEDCISRHDGEADWQCPHSFDAQECGEHGQVARFPRVDEYHGWS
jgi:hypothetical protein